MNLDVQAPRRKPRARGVGRRIAGEPGVVGRTLARFGRAGLAGHRQPRVGQRRVGRPLGIIDHPGQPRRTTSSCRRPSPSTGRRGGRLAERACAVGRGRAVDDVRRNELSTIGDRGHQPRNLHRRGREPALPDRKGLRISRCPTSLARAVRLRCGTWPKVSPGRSMPVARPKPSRSANRPSAPDRSAPLARRNRRCNAG